MLFGVSLILGLLGISDVFRVCADRWKKACRFRKLLCKVLELSSA